VLSVSSRIQQSIAMSKQRFFSSSAASETDRLAFTSEFMLQSRLPERAAPLFTFPAEATPWVSEWQGAGTARLVRSWNSVSFRIGWWDGSHAVVVNPDLQGQVLVDFHPGPEGLRFLNSSVACLQACLEAYQVFEADAIAKVGEDAFYEGEFPDSAFESLFRALEQADPACLAEGCFWNGQLEMDMAIRNDYRRGLQRLISGQ
jgi:hypothetical protein